MGIICSKGETYIAVQTKPYLTKQMSRPQDLLNAGGGGASKNRKPNNANKFVRYFSPSATAATTTAPAPALCGDPPGRIPPESGSQLRAVRVGGQRGVVRADGPRQAAEGLPGLEKTCFAIKCPEKNLSELNFERIFLFFFAQHTGIRTQGFSFSLI